MKKILALVSFLSLLIFAAACTTEPTTKTSSNANTPTTKSAAPSQADMIAKETAAWETLKKKDLVAFADLLASNYVEVTAEKVYDKTGIVADVKDFNITDATFSDWKMMPIDNDAVILTYQTTLKATYKGADVPPGPYRSAAVWVNRDGKWSALYFQQTPVTTMQPPPPAASSTKPEKAAPASPAAKPAETGPDPIVNEKIVWDLFRSKNVDGFAALLDSTFVEIETNAVYDKATAIKGVGDYDFSQFELSEWKATNIDNDAALVTYLLKSKDPKMDPERHTSIWAIRNGKWVAVLHVGTPVAKPAAKPESKKI
jgi:hypothetical protein